MAKENEQDSTEEKQKHESSLASNSSHQDENTAHHTINHSQSKKQIFSEFWRKIWHGYDASTKANIVMATCNIAALIIIYIMSSNQNELSRQSLVRADTSNAFTRRSNAFQIKAWQEQWIRDSINAIKQDSKDSLLIRSQKNRDSLSFESFIIENKPNLSIISISPPKVGKRIGTLIMLSNSGKTPAIILNSIAITGFGGDGFSNSMIASFPKVIVNSFEIHSGINYPLWAYPQKNETIFGISDSINVYSGTIRMYIAGEINYTDIFQRKYLLRFNVVFDPIHQQFGDYNHK